MTRFSSSILLLMAMAASSPVAAAAQDAQPLPSPLTLKDVIRIAGERRDEIQAARARTRTGEARPAIVSALSDPMISPSLDHLPFMFSGADVSVAIEQQIPLSGIRGHRRESALADLDRLRAEAHRTTLDVGIEAVNAYLMLQERRRTATLLDEQIAFARSVVSAANARYASGTAPQFSRRTANGSRMASGGCRPIGESHRTKNVWRARLPLSGPNVLRHRCRSAQPTTACITSSIDRVGCCWLRKPDLGS